MTASEKPLETGNPTSEGAEDKAQPAVAKPAQPVRPLTLDERVLLRRKEIEDVMREKEELMLRFVEKKIPRPYYVRWKGEANECYALLVNLKHRRARQKAG